MNVVNDPQNATLSGPWTSANGIFKVPRVTEYRLLTPLFSTFPEFVRDEFRRLSPPFRRRNIHALRYVPRVQD